MKSFAVAVLTALTGLALGSPGLNAQQPSGQPYMVLPSGQPYTVQPSGQPYTVQPSGQPYTVCPETCCQDCPHTCKVCVREPKKNTKTVYSCKCEDYCLPHCSLRGLLKGKCDCEDGGPCGKLRVRHRLIVKKVPTCDTHQCVPREVLVPEHACNTCGGPPNECCEEIVPGK